MNTLTDTPVSVQQPDFPAQPEIVAETATLAAPNPRQRNSRRLKELLVMTYAYGLLGFGILFPLLLAAWAAFFAPDSG